MHRPTFATLLLALLALLALAAEVRAQGAPSETATATEISTATATDTETATDSDPHSDSDSDYGFGASASVSAPLVADDRDATAASTAVSARNASRADLSLQELLFEVPGAHVVQSGGQGSYSTVSLRGGELGHTGFLLGEMPVSGPDSGPLDLSLLPLEVFDRLEVYRGGAPAFFDSGAIGGVVRLVPREDRESRLFASATAGNFGAWRADVTSTLRRGRFFVATNAGADGARNDYAYRYDNATIFDPSDDETRSRANAETLGAHGMLHVRGTVGHHGRVSALLLGVSRQGGMPGLGASPAYEAQREDTRVLGALEYQHCGEHGRLQLVLGGSLRRQRFTDLLGEVGIGREATDDQFRHVFTRIAGVVQPTPWLELTSVGSARFDTYDPENRLAPVESSSSRTTLSFTQELRLHGTIGRGGVSRRGAIGRGGVSRRGANGRGGVSRRGAIGRGGVSRRGAIGRGGVSRRGAIGRGGVSRRGANGRGVALELRPSVRVEHARTEAFGLRLGQEVRHASELTRATFRVGVSIQPLPWMAVVGSAASGARMPSVLELFGDRGALLPNAELRPEQGRSADAGVILRLERERGRVLAEARYFHLAVDELIRYAPTSQYTAIAQNVARGEVNGVEAGTRFELPLTRAEETGPGLAGQVSFTYLKTRAPRGAELPWRPDVEARAGLELRSGRLGPIEDLVLLGTWNHRGEFFHDPANLVRMPSRHWVGAGVRVDLPRGFDVLFMARDLANEAGQDFLGQPLPGRRVALTVRYEMEL